MEASQTFSLLKVECLRALSPVPSFSYCMLMTSPPSLTAPQRCLRMTQRSIGVWQDRKTISRLWQPGQEGWLSFPLELAETALPGLRLPSPSKWTSSCNEGTLRQWQLRWEGWLSLP